MLVVSRSAGQTLMVGEARLEILQVRPTLQIAVRQTGKDRVLEFTRQDVYRNTAITVQDGRVVLARFKHGEIILAVDAPRSVSIMRGELIGKPKSPHDDS